MSGNPTQATESAGAWRLAGGYRFLVIHRISAEQAFRVLSWRSQETDTKLRDLAYRLMATLPEFHGCGVGDRTRFHHFLLNLHERPAPTP